MVNTTTITTEQIDKLINICNDTKVSSDDIGVELNELYNLTTQKDIENCLLEYLVGFGLIKLSDDQQLIYKGFDLTEYYQDAYFRYFEDGVE
jgi:hypothetical protein